MKINTCLDHLPYYKLRLKIQQKVEEYLQKKNYLKVDLPVLSPALIPESYLEIFKTEFRYFKQKEKLYLTPSPELFLKRLLAYGVGNCFYLGKSFRNNELNSNLHQFEFMMLEIYKIKANYMNIADELLGLLQFLAKELYQRDYIFYQGKKTSFEKWEKISVTQAFEKYAQIAASALFNKKVFFQKVKEKGYQTKGFSYEDLFSQIYSQEVEPNLGKNGIPALIYDYPQEFAALAKLNTDKKTAQRFEFYIQGVELGDCYTELTDWHEQKERFKKEKQKRLTNHKMNHPIDKGFIEALKYGLIDCAGIAIGFDRLAMLFCNVDSIHKLNLINIE